MDAGGNILDFNAAAVNVVAPTVRMTAGGSIGQADLVNVNPDANANAIDLQVDTVAALAGTGIYLQELGGDLIIGRVNAIAINVTVPVVEFRSTLGSRSIDRNQTALDDLETTNNGSIKVRVDSGTLTVTEGDDNDNVGVRAHGTGDVMLRAIGPASDVLVTDDLGINGEARISSGLGHITLRAQDDIVLDAQVFTGGSGSIFIDADSFSLAGPLDGIDVNRTITNVNGDILLRSDFDISSMLTSAQPAVTLD